MTIVDPVYNERTVFKKRLEALVDWRIEVPIKDFIDAIAKQQDLQPIITKINRYEAYINQKLNEWDTATTEQERRVVVYSVKKQNFRGEI